MDRLLGICNEYEVPVIEDAAESLGASYRGSEAGSFGTVSFLSFNGNKIITTSGGGMLLTNDAEIEAKARYLAHQAREPVLHYEHNAIGYNYRISNLLAGLGLSQFNALEDKISKRKSHYIAYKEVLEGMGGIEFMPIAKEGIPNYWLTIFQIVGLDANAKRDALIETCSKASIEVRPTWKPLHLQSVFKSTRYFGGEVSETLYNGGLCLPSGSCLSLKERDEVIDIVRTALSKWS